MSRIQSVAQPSHNRPTLCVTKAASGSINLQDEEHGYTEAQARTLPHSKGSRPSAEVPETIYPLSREWSPPDRQPATLRMLYIRTVSPAPFFPAFREDLV